VGVLSGVYIVALAFAIRGGGRYSLDRLIGYEV